ncbi:MAG: DUF1223 domain-containing protein [Zoogloeaceae bacterium]|nr:DUF1223 domain-containing protein [Zoogloeaceae bacterium]
MKSAEHLVPVVELFTSEGCNSCPPADRWLSGLSSEMRSRPLSVLAYHVDYWDYIGWRDRFADPAHGRRHQQHVAATGGRIRYTPQVFVDGREYTAWRNGARPSSKLRAQLGLEATLSPLATDRAIKLRLAGSSQTSPPAMLTVALVENGLASEVIAGENAGRRLAHDFVVRDIADQALADGDFHTEVTLRVPPYTQPQSTSVVVIVRDQQLQTLQSMVMPLCDG